MGIYDLKHPRVIRFKLENHSSARAAFDQISPEPEVVLLSKDIEKDRNRAGLAPVMPQLQIRHAHCRLREAFRIG